MMPEFIDFTKSLFPSIDPYIAEEVKNSLKQFEENGGRYKCFTNRSFSFFSQGDIIDKLKFIKVNDSGQIIEKELKALLLSNTCDAENDDVLLCAPLISLTSLKVDQDTLKKNRIYKLLYFPGYRYDDYVVDLSLVSSFSKVLINKLLENEIIKKEASLSDFGYYLFLSKLTVHFMRPENTEVQEMREV
jgi:hypothetical protein